MAQPVAPGENQDLLDMAQPGTISNPSRAPGLARAGHDQRPVPRPGPRPRRARSATRPAPRASPAPAPAPGHLCFQLTICANSPDLYFVATTSSGSGLIFEPIPADPNC